VGQKLPEVTIIGQPSLGGCVLLLFVAWRRDDKEGMPCGNVQFRCRLYGTSGFGLSVAEIQTFALCDALQASG